MLLIAALSAVCKISTVWHVNYRWDTSLFVMTYRDTMTARDLFTPP